MSQWREVHIKFEASDNEAKEKLTSFMSSFIKAHPDYIDPAAKDSFRVFGWIRKWDERNLSIHEDEMCTAYIGFVDEVLPFFEQLNGAIPGVSYEGELVRFDNGGECSKQTRKVLFDGSAFTTSVDYWFEDEEDLEDSDAPDSQEEAASSLPPIQVGKIVKSGRATKKGNAFSWTFDESGTLTIFAEKEGDAINGFEWNTVPWYSFQSKIKRAQFLDGIRAKRLDNLFNCCCCMEEVRGIGLIDSSELTSVHGMFIDCEELKSIDLSGLDTSHVDDMAELFNGCVSLKAIDLSMLDTSSVTTMYWMFVACSSLQTVNLSTLSFESVRDMRGFFEDCTALEMKNVDLSGAIPPGEDADQETKHMFAELQSLSVNHSSQSE